MMSNNRTKTIVYIIVILLIQQAGKANCIWAQEQDNYVGKNFVEIINFYTSYPYAEGPKTINAKIDGWFDWNLKGSLPSLSMPYFKYYSTNRIVAEPINKAKVTVSSPDKSIEWELTGKYYRSIGFELKTCINVSSEYFLIPLIKINEPINKIFCKGDEIGISIAHKSTYNCNTTTITNGKYFYCAELQMALENPASADLKSVLR